jgi:hypothetical protein
LREAFVITGLEHDLNFYPTEQEALQSFRRAAATPGRRLSAQSVKASASATSASPTPSR